MGESGVIHVEVGLIFTDVISSTEDSNLAESSIIVSRFINISFYKLVLTL